MRRLIALSRELSAEEQRGVVKGVAKRLLAHVHEKLVLDWRRKAETMADVRVAIRDTLDELPADPYPRPVYDAKVQAVFDHVCTVYGGDGWTRSTPLAR